MRTLLLDASVWLAALDPDDRYHTAAKALVESVDGDSAAEHASEREQVTLAALDLTLYEVANIAVVRWRSQPDAEHLAELIGLTCPGTIGRIDDERVSDAATIAAEHDLTVYDAAYVAAARRHDWTLVSCDLKDLVRPGHAIDPEAAISA